mgnify:CR=1 FL=1
MFEQRQYLIFDVAELDQIDFDCVLETSTETIRKSVDETKTFVKWEGDAPDCVMNLTSADGPYTHSEILDILATEEWTAPIDEELGGE